MTNFARMTLAQLIKTPMTPEAKLRAAAKWDMKRRSRQRVKSRAQLVDLSEHGRVLMLPQLRPKERARFAAARWEGRDYLVTVPWFIQRWPDWPQAGKAKNTFKANMRQGARAFSTLALRALPVDFGYVEGVRPWLPDLAPMLESVGVVRLVPKHVRKMFEEDSLIHWCHHLRDGVYDTFAGMKLDKNGSPIWLGQDADDNNKPGFIPCQYNQLHAGGHGVVFVFRFKQEAVERYGLTG